MLRRSRCQSGFVLSTPLCSTTAKGFLQSSWCASPTRRSLTKSKRRYSYRGTPVARESRGPPPNPPIYDAIHLIPPMFDINLAHFDFSQLQGKVVYAVNVASQDEASHDNYTLMAQLASTFKGQDFVVLAFPCNWFLQKETWANDKIKEFVDNYSSDIVVMNKFDYEMNPVFALAQEYFPGEILWNFHGKFLFNREGIPIERFDLLTDSEVIVARVREACSMPAPNPKKVRKASKDRKETKRANADVEASMETAQ